jgi:hypothetical protein
LSNCNLIPTDLQQTAQFLLKEMKPAQSGSDEGYITWQEFDTSAYASASGMALPPSVSLATQNLTGYSNPQSPYGGQPNNFNNYSFSQSPFFPDASNNSGFSNAFNPTGQ